MDHSLKQAEFVEESPKAKGNNNNKKKTLDFEGEDEMFRGVTRKSID